MKVLDDNTLVEVWNNHGWGVSYVTDKITRTWQTSGVVKKIAFGELYEAMSFKGNRVLFEENALLIKDNEVRARLDLPPLNEYSLDLKEMKELLEQGDVEKIEDFLQYCSNMTLDAFVQVAIDLPVSNVSIVNLIGEYANVNVLAAIQEKMENSLTNKDSSPNVNKPRPKRIIKE